MVTAKGSWSDQAITIELLKQLVEEFVSKRDWAQFHSPKNLAMAIGVEAGELMDLFRWHSDMESSRSMLNKAIRKAATEELSDIVICALSFANRTGIDIAIAVKRKIAKNAKKYPVHRYKGATWRVKNTKRPVHN